MWLHEKKLAFLTCLAMQSDKLTRDHTNNSHTLNFITTAAIRLQHFESLIHIFSAYL